MPNLQKKLQIILRYDYKNTKTFKLTNIIFYPTVLGPNLCEKNLSVILNGSSKYIIWNHHILKIWTIYEFNYLFIILEPV